MDKDPVEPVRCRRGRRPDDPQTTCPAANFRWRWGFRLTPSDEGAVEPLRETGGEKQLSCFLSLRLLLRKIHLPRQREAPAAAGLLIWKQQEILTVVGVILQQAFANNCNFFKFLLTIWYRKCILLMQQGSS